MSVVSALVAKNMAIEASGRHAVKYLAVIETEAQLGKFETRLQLGSAEEVNKALVWLRGLGYEAYLDWEANSGNVIAVAWGHAK